MRCIGSSEQKDIGVSVGLLSNDSYHHHTLGVGKVLHKWHLPTNVTTTTHTTTDRGWLFRHLAGRM